MGLGTNIKPYLPFAPRMWSSDCGAARRPEGPLMEVEGMPGEESGGALDTLLQRFWDECPPLALAVLAVEDAPTVLWALWPRGSLAW